MFDTGKLVMEVQKSDYDLRELTAGALIGDLRLNMRIPNLVIQRPVADAKLHKKEWHLKNLVTNN